MDWRRGRGAKNIVESCTKSHGIGPWAQCRGEDYEEACRHRGELALAGQRWADDNHNEPERFSHKLHGMFMAVLWATMQREEEACLLFPLE